MSVIVVNDAKEFDGHLERAKAQGCGVLVDFMAEWCGPCKFVAPKVKELAAEFPTVIFLKVDVDQCQDLSQKYGVRAMPTFLGLMNGEKVGEVVGANLDAIRELIEKLKPIAFSGSGNKVGGDAASTLADDEAAAREARAKAAEARLK